MNLAVKVGRLELKNPVLTASGTFGFGTEFASYGDISTLGGIVVKGLSCCLFAACSYCKPLISCQVINLRRMPRIVETLVGC